MELWFNSLGRWSTDSPGDETPHDNKLAEDYCDTEGSNDTVNAIYGCGEGEGLPYTGGDHIGGRANETI